MHRGYIKQWRREIESAIWDRPPLYYKVWRWLLITADYQSGTVKNVNLPYIGQAVQWSERGGPVVPGRTAIRSILRWLEAQNMISQSLTGGANAERRDITVCNWELYQNDAPRSERQENAKQTPSEHNTRSTKNVPHPTPPPISIAPEAISILANWNGELPKTANRIECLKAINDLNRLDGLSWERIAAIDAYARKNWVPEGYLGSPLKYRKKTRSGEMRIWEAIERQIKTNAPKQTERATEYEEVLAELMARTGTTAESFRAETEDQPRGQR